MELLYVDDLVLMAETEELQMGKSQKFKMSMEENGLVQSVDSWKVLVNCRMWLLSDVRGVLMGFCFKKLWP